MAQMPREPEAFAEQVVAMLRRIRPEFEIKLTGPTEMVVNGRRLDFDNLARLVRTNEDRGLEIVEQYLDHLFDEDSLNASVLPWDIAKLKIMPRIQPATIFQHLSRDMVAHVPYVNDTVVVFVIDMPHMTVSVTTEQLVRWAVTLDELDDVARVNLARYTPTLELRTLDSREGGRAILVANQDGYDASRLLLERLFEKLAPEFGGDFLVACPSRDMFLALTPEPEPFVERVRSRVDHDYLRLPYPITNKLFYVTRDGVAGTETAAA